MKKTAVALTILLLLAMAAFSGCGSKPEAAPTPAKDASTPAAASSPSAVPSPAETPAPTAAPTPAPTAAPATAPTAVTDAPAHSEETPPQPTDDGFIRVSSPKELLEAIRPNVDILIEPGRYNLTDYLKEIPDLAEWNESHEYVQILEVFDGLEIFVKNASGLSIEGDSDDPAAVELVVDPRYAAVLNFSDCPNLSLGCLTMGHTDMGDCSGNVLEFDGCRGILLHKMDLYGCGVYGIGCNDFSGDLIVTDSVIRDCAYGIFEILNGAGEFRFTDCSFTGSGWGGYFEYNENSTLSFQGCFFGEQESNAWYFDESASFEGCTWSEITSYPDYGDYSDWEPPVLDLKNVTPMPFDRERFEDSWWVGYARMNPESLELQYFIGETEEEYEYAGLAFDEDGTGWYSHGDDIVDFTWVCTDEDSLILTADDVNYAATLYAGDTEDAGYQVWLLLSWSDELIWFY